MDSTGAADGDLAGRLETAVADRLDERVEWDITVETTDCTTVSLPDRRLVVRRRDGPDGIDHWTLELAADGATVSKFGPFETPDGLTERVGTLLESEVRYTVCCDG